MAESSAIDWTPGQGDYMPKGAVKRKDEYGRFDITTPKHLIDYDDNYIAVLSTGENRHPNEDEMIEHYARQLAGKKNGTYDPMEDTPVYIRDLLPTVWVVVNKVFTKHEVTMGGDAVIKKYVKSLQQHIDFDIVPALCGKVVVLPLHPLLPKEHRDPVFNQHMQSFYKQHDEGAQDILNRMVKAREESTKQKVEQFEREAAEHGDHVKQAAIDSGRLLPEDFIKYGTGLPKKSDKDEAQKTIEAEVEKATADAEAEAATVDEEDDA